MAYSKDPFGTNKRASEIIDSLFKGLSSFSSAVAKSNKKIEKDSRMAAKENERIDKYAIDLLSSTKKKLKSMNLCLNKIGETSDIKVLNSNFELVKDYILFFVINDIELNSMSPIKASDIIYGNKNENIIRIAKSKMDLFESKSRLIKDKSMIDKIAINMFELIDCCIKSLEPSESFPKSKSFDELKKIKDKVEDIYSEM